MGGRALSPGACNHSCTTHSLPEFISLLSPVLFPSNVMRRSASWVSLVLVAPPNCPLSHPPTRIRSCPRGPHTDFLERTAHFDLRLQSPFAAGDTSGGAGGGDSGARRQAADAAPRETAGTSAAAAQERAQSGAAASGSGGPLRVACAGPGTQLGFLSALRVTARLNALCGSTFPLPHGASAAQPQPPADAAGGGGGGGVLPGRLLSRVRLPAVGAAISVDVSACPPLDCDLEELQREARELLGTLGKGADTESQKGGESEDELPANNGSAAEQPRGGVPLLPAAPAAAAAPADAEAGATRNSTAAAALRRALLTGGRPAAAGGSKATAPPQPHPIPPPAPPPGPAPAYARPPPARASPRLLFLGTGCAEPSKYRGGSAILLSVPPPPPPLAAAHNPPAEEKFALLDAGEGCAGALLRALGPDAARRALRSLRLVLISHHHADHLLGLPGLLAAAAEAGAPSPPVVVGARRPARAAFPRLTPHGDR